VQHTPKQQHRNRLPLMLLESMPESYFLAVCIPAKTFEQV
jgi:hypothetical protein